MAVDVRVKRVYEPAAASDGYRVLIDRLWPRGVSRERADLDERDRELAPSTGEIKDLDPEKAARHRERLEVQRQELRDRTQRFEAA